ncbi:MAG: bifunctional oligoribonuclease/PAP phosphatase NrnA [Elusimicrobiota bacterium]|jgi:phosphoesterase RecJ-like protein|nr:bifunctional oligoribonuclease/PAP phosphatase NrnA [Elusimicrobiota bacterium]
MKKQINKSDLKKLAKISQIIKQSKTFFIAGHSKPDGDSLGAAFALRSMLHKLGKKAEVYCLDKIPPSLSLIKPFSQVKTSVKKSDLFDCAIILESLNFERMGNIISAQQAKKIINIDHHLLYGNFADVNYVVADSSSVSELVLNLFEFMKIKPNKEETQNLYIGLVTDTGYFKQANTNANSHIAAQKLLSLGVSPDFVERNIFSQKTLSSLNLLGAALANIKIWQELKTAYMIIDQKMFKKTKSSQSDIEGIISYSLKLKGIKAGVLFVEEEKNSIKVGFRSHKEFDVLSIAKKFGGGGHKNAAGCVIKKDLNSVIKIIKGAFNAR